jgi:hypothetical protein
MGPNFVLDKGFLVNTSQTVSFGLVAVLADATHVNTAGAAAQSLGIYQETLDAAKVATGKATANVRILGISRVIAGANNIAIGARLASNASGQVVAIATAVGTVYWQVGIALTASTAIGDQIDVLLTPGVSYNTAVS